MIEIQSMSPMLSVYDMPTSLKFYCDVLGWRLGSSLGGRAPDCDWAYLTLNGSDLMLKAAYEKESRPPALEAARVTGHRDAAICFSCPDVEEAYTYLKAAGAPVQPPVVAAFGLRQLYVTDPDGYVLCFQKKAKPKII